MKLQCTKSLLDELKLDPIEKLPYENNLFSWHCNLIKINRKKMIILVNDLIRCSIVLYGLKAKDFKKLDILVREAIKEVFAAGHISEEIIERYLADSGEIRYTKTQGKPMVARMNSTCRDAKFYVDYLNPYSIIQKNMSREVNGCLTKGLDKEYIYPDEQLQRCLKEYYGQEVKYVRAIELKVILELDNYSTYRNVTVPEDISFERLHKILQLVFNWKDYHLHEFSSIKEDEVIQRIISYEDEFDFGDMVKKTWEKHTILSDVLINNQKLLYVYDFGDNWRHHIEFVGYIEDYKEKYPICTKGEGYTPPEDVGGEYGFEEFLKVIEDQSHDEYENMRMWCEGLGFEAFDEEVINKRLQRGVFRI